MIDSPLGFCPICRVVVLLDQTQAECARDHRCNPEHCPFTNSFTGIEFKGGAVGMPARHRTVGAKHGR